MAGMNILLLRPIFEPGGATRAIVQLARGLVARGHTVSLAAHRWDWLADSSIAAMPVDYVPFHPSTPASLIQSITALRRIVRRRKIDLMHSHHRFTSVSAQVVSTLSGVPVVSTVHEFRFNQLWLTRFGLRGQVATYSQALKDHLVQHYRIPAQCIQVQSMGIDLAAYPSVVRQKVESPVPVIGCLARLVDGKGMDVLIRALAEVRRMWSDPFVCRIIGDGPLRPVLEELVVTLELANYVQFIGWQDDILSSIAQTNFLVLPSLQEGLGLVILEGWLLAKPTVGSNVGGIPELIQHQHNGLLVPPGDAVALAEAIIALLQHPDQVKRLGQAGWETVQRCNTLDTMIDQTEQLYRAVLD
ncbi:MAG: glycosyltransferase family 4 protein [Anaerolineae bacterium]|nr:glycosyltransferase family 4 protein [Anaerolineae bacterium]